MVNFTVDQIRWLMDFPDNIRNISVIAHVDHGKSTLTDSLICHAGIIAKRSAGVTRFMDTRKDEQERTITIKSTGVSLFFEMAHVNLEGEPRELAVKQAAEFKAGRKPVRVIKPWTPTDPAPTPAAAPKEDEEGISRKPEPAVADDVKAEEKAATTPVAGSVEAKEGCTPYLINLIDSPGHVDFSAEVTAALRVTDGALVVVDCVEGCSVQTETVLRQAIAERIRPVLFVNKLDRLFLEVHMDLEEAYQTFVKAMESVNVVIATYKDDLLGDVQVCPERGTVGFGSGLQGWGFTLLDFARMYAARFAVDERRMMRYLWGDHFYDPENKRWSTVAVSKTSGKKLERGFCGFVLRPIQQLFRTIMDNQPDVYNPMLAKLKVKLTTEESEYRDKRLLKAVMQTWLPAAPALLSMIVNHLPSPVVAQKYRVENLYSGPLDDECAHAIRHCDPDGPLMMYVSKMVPAANNAFYAFGRVFSGTLAQGQTVRIQLPEYVPTGGGGKNPNVKMMKIPRCVLMMGRTVEPVPSAPCGNTIALVGFDHYLQKSGTIATSKDAHNIVDMRYAVSPVVRVAVEPINAADLPKLVEGLKRLAMSDPLVQCTVSPTGEHIVAGAGELHLEICIKDLREDFLKGCPITVAKPNVPFRETVTALSSVQSVTKSSNKHNRFYMTAEPMGEALVTAIEKKTFALDGDLKARARTLIDQHGWDETCAKKIWAFGLPPDAHTNAVVDMTKGVAYMPEIRDSVTSAFLHTTSKEGGVYCHEPLRGTRWNIEDVVLHADAVHRGPGQIAPPFQRAMYACQMKALPVLLEPIYLCEISAPLSALAGTYSTLAGLRGKVEGKEDRPGTPMCKIRAFLPVLESFGFTNRLRAATAGQAFPQLLFDHWSTVPGDIEDDKSMAHRLVMEVRRRKGLKDSLPSFSEYYDKI